MRLPSSSVKALNHGSRTELVWSGRGSSHTSHWFANVESANDFVIYVADAGTTPWSKLCVRQADALLPLPRLAQKRHRAASSRRSGKSRLTLQRAELVLLQESGVVRRIDPSLAHATSRTGTSSRALARRRPAHCTFADRSWCWPSCFPVVERAASRISAS